MPTRHERTRSLKRKQRRLPGGRHTTHYRRKKAGRPICSSCRTYLKGVSTSTAKTKRRPQRTYGGVLCFNCLQKMMIERARTTQ
jgi:large subunit ribosomal protein L34e